MDPDEALKNAREATDRLQRLLAQDSHVLTTTLGEWDNQLALDAAEDLANAFGALDTWLTAGGFLPEAWSR